MDPGTAAIATLATLAGVSGYGAMKVNKNQDVVIEQKVQERIAQTEERLKDTQEALEAVEAVKTKQAAQLAAIQKELDILRNAKTTVETRPTVTPTRFTTRFFPTSRTGPIERDFTPVVVANPDDITPTFIPPPAIVPDVSPPASVSDVSPPASVSDVSPPTSVPAPLLESETVESLPRTLPEEPEERVSFTPETMQDRLRIIKERAAKLKEDNGSDAFMSRMDDARKGALADVKKFPTLPSTGPTMTNIPPLPPTRPTIATLPKLQSPTTVPTYRFTPPTGEPTTLTASVPITNRQAPPRAPPINTKRQTRRKPTRPPPLPRGGMRKKKLRTRRVKKQRNVRRTGSR